MTAVAIVSTHTIYVSGTLETEDRAVIVTYDLPSADEWTFVKTETNLSDQVWTSWLMSVDKDGEFVDRSDRPTVSPQFAKHHFSEDHSRLGFFDGEVRPGESILKQFNIKAPSRRFYMCHGKRGKPGGFLPSEFQATIDMIDNGYELYPTYEISVPVELRP